MVTFSMEHTGPSGNPSPRDILPSCRREELCCSARGTLGEGQNPLGPPEMPPTETSPFLWPEDLDFCLNGWQGAQSGTEISGGSKGLALSTQKHTVQLCAGAAAPLLEGLEVCTVDLPGGGHLLPGSPESQERSLGDATQALFQASIRQAQLCVQELQGEINRQKASPKSSPLSPLQNALAPHQGQESVVFHKPLLLATDSEEEEEEKEEEESLSEEEMECLFYNNPLFQENPGPTRTISFEESALEGHQTGLPFSLRRIPSSGLFSRALKEDLFCQANMARNPSVPAPAACEANPFLGSLPNCRSLSPLVITEGELDVNQEEEEEEESVTVQQCVPPQPAHSLPRSASESPSAGGDPPVQGLLFSICTTSLTSVLLQEPSEHHLPQQPPSCPRESRRTPSHISRMPSALTVEQSPWQKESQPQVPLHGHWPSSCAWAKEPQGASCLREEGSAQDLHSASLSGCGRKLQEGSTEEEAAVVAVGAFPTQPSEESDKQEEGEEEPLASQHCPQGFSGDSSDMALDLGTKGQVHPDGLLFANGTSGDQTAALCLATRLYHLDGFKRSQVAAFLQKNNEFSRMVAQAYLSFFHFQGQALDQALRSFLKAFVLTGETQERERILQHFSQRYHSCNPEAFLSPDAVHTLTCALMLLNTDLHGQKIGRSMSCQAFLINLHGLNDGQSFPKELLKGLYHSIRQEKLEWAVDEEELEASSTSKSLASSSASSQKKNDPFLVLLYDPGAQTYRQGPLARKVHAEADRKKTPWGKRGWKSFYAVLKGTVLYFFKDENWTEALEEPIGVHHALAERASKYTKRPHVFRLQTADWRIFLFQAQGAEEMSSWISRINLVAAMFSSPPFPEAVGSQRKFVRPILPTAPCKNSLEEQYQAHEGCMDRASDDLQELQRNLPDKRSRGRHLEEYQLRKEYLLYEKRRYETYLRLLEVKLHCPTAAASEDLEQWEAHLEEAAEEGSCPLLQKSHSSPSLNVEGSPSATTTAAAATAKVKRNISERRTVRKIIPRRNKHLL